MLSNLCSRLNKKIIEIECYNNPMPNNSLHIERNPMVDLSDEYHVSSEAQSISVAMFENETKDNLLILATDYSNVWQCILDENSEFENILGLNNKLETYEWIEKAIIQNYNEQITAKHSKNSNYRHEFRVYHSKRGFIMPFGLLHLTESVNNTGTDDNSKHTPNNTVVKSLNIRLKPVRINHIDILPRNHQYNSDFSNCYNTSVICCGFLSSNCSLRSHINTCIEKLNEKSNSVCIGCDKHRRSNLTLVFNTIRKLKDDFTITLAKNMFNISQQRKPRGVGVGSGVGNGVGVGDSNNLVDSQSNIDFNANSQNKHIDSQKPRPGLGDCDSESDFELEDAKVEKKRKRYR